MRKGKAAIGIKGYARLTSKLISASGEIFAISQSRSKVACVTSSAAFSSAIFAASYSLLRSPSSFPNLLVPPFGICNFVYEVQGKATNTLTRKRLLTAERTRSRMALARSSSFKPIRCLADSMMSTGKASPPVLAYARLNAPKPENKSRKKTPLFEPPPSLRLRGNIYRFLMV